MLDDGPNEHDACKNGAELSKEVSHGNFVHGFFFFNSFLSGEKLNSKIWKRASFAFIYLHCFQLSVHLLEYLSTSGDLSEDFLII